MTGQALLLRANARALPLADASVDLVVTSPPFYALRSYTDGGEHYAGQLGAESTPAEYLEGLWAATAEMARVLKASGSIWVELGDKYSQHEGQRKGHGQTFHDGRGRGEQLEGAYRAPQQWGIPAKSLMGMPWRYAIGCIDQLGLILRAEVIWDRPNGLPESVTDRVRRSHSTWFHFVKQPRYYSAVDEVREPHSPVSVARAGRNRFAEDRSQDGVGSPNTINPQQACNPLGKLPGSVWSIPSEPLQVPAHLGVSHFAAFPSELPRRLILGWSPPGICCACGQGRVPVVARELTVNRKGQQSQRVSSAVNGGATGQTLGWERETSILGHACACTPYTDHPERRRPSVSPRPSGSLRAEVPPNGKQHAWPERLPVREYHLDGWPAPPTRPAVVLDPFSGTGTTVMVARALGRHGVGVDLSADYLRLASWRVHHSGHAGKAESRTWLERQEVLL